MSMGFTKSVGFYSTRVVTLFAGKCNFHPCAVSCVTLPNDDARIIVRHVHAVRSGVSWHHDNEYVGLNGDVAVLRVCSWLGLSSGLH